MEIERLELSTLLLARQRPPHATPGTGPPPKQPTGFGTLAHHAATFQGTVPAAV